MNSRNHLDKNNISLPSRISTHSVLPDLPPETGYDLKKQSTPHSLESPMGNLDDEITSLVGRMQDKRDKQLTGGVPLINPSPYPAREAKRVLKHPTVEFRETMAEIRHLGVGDEEMALVQAFDILLGKYFDDVNSRIDDMNERMDSLDADSEEMFNQIVSDNIREVTTEAEEIVSRLKSGTLSDEEATVHIVKLSQAVSSEAVEEAKEFSSEQLSALHNAVVTPIKRELAKQTEELKNDNIEQYENIVHSLGTLSGALKESIDKAKKEVLRSFGTTNNKIDSIKANRRLL